MLSGSLKEGFRVLKKLGVPVTPSRLEYFKLPDRLLAAVFCNFTAINYLFE
ncbi:MAG TPA: hypothetical protein VN580_04905 [Clostridia bacterium]|nr:hypothetical protein [Clostridia bacterium]